MTYNTEYLAADFFGFIKALQRHCGNEPHALKLARLLEIRARIGVMNRSIPDAEGGPRVIVQPWWYGNSDVMRHELAHVMLFWSGLEEEIIQEYGDETGWKVIENLCWQAVTFLRITQPMLDDALHRHGLSGQAVAHLQRLTRCPPEMALRRVVYDDPKAERAGWVSSGAYIRDIAQCNWGLPFTWAERVPEPAAKFPLDARFNIHRLPDGFRSLGVCWG